MWAKHSQKMSTANKKKIFLNGLQLKCQQFTNKTFSQKQIESNIVKLTYICMYVYPGLFPVCQALRH